MEGVPDYIKTYSARFPRIMSSILDFTLYSSVRSMNVGLPFVGLSFFFIFLVW
jgi:hypothetical protein